MRAMAGPGIAVAVRHECIDFWLGKGISRLDRRPTGETVQHLLNHQAAVTPSGIVVEFDSWEGLRAGARAISKK